MKKLLIVAAIAATASLAHAGAYTWGLASGADAAPGQVPDDVTGDGYLVGGTAMLFLGTIAETSTGEGSGIDAKYSLDFSGLTQIATSGQDGTLYTFGNTEFVAPGVSNDNIDVAGGQAFSIILFDQDGVTDYENYEGYYAIYTGTSGSSYDADSSTSYADFTTLNAFSGSDWKTAGAASPIPEPTSGLLLLLGMAGLALKRKRA